MDFEMSSVNMGGLVRALKDEGVYEAVLAQVRPETRAALTAPHSARWHPSAIAVDANMTIIRTLGAAKFEQVNYRMGRDSLGPLILPVVKVALALSGASPTSILERLDSMVKVTNRGLRCSWQSASPAGGVLGLEYGCDCPPEMIEGVWRGLLRFGSELTGKPIRVERFQAQSPRTFSLQLGW